MTSYRFDKEQQVRRWWYVLGTLAIVLVFFTPLLTIVYDSFERSILSAWERSDQNYTTTKSFLANLGSKEKLLQENKNLSDKLAILEVDILRTHYLESVLESYEAIDQEYQQRSVVISAEVIAHYPKAPRDTIVINRGSQDGVSLGSRAVVENNLAVGVVEEVFDYSSRIRLYTKDGILTQAVLYSSGEGITLTGNGSMYSALLPRESEVIVGDVAYTQDTPGMVLAVVREVVFDPRDPMKQVFFALPVNLNTIQTVAILE